MLKEKIIFFLIIETFEIKTKKRITNKILKKHLTNYLNQANIKNSSILLFLKLINIRLKQQLVVKLDYFDIKNSNLNRFFTSI